MQPGSRADVWMFSDAMLLGVVTVAEDGTFRLDVAVDPRFIGTGAHTLQVQGLGTDGYVRSANVAVVVEDGSELDTMPGGRLGRILTLLNLLAGSAFFLIAWRRRDDDEEEVDGQGTDGTPPSSDRAQAPDEQDGAEAPPR